MSDLSGFTAVDPTPGPRRQGTTPDPELEALLSEYATNRQEPASAAASAPSADVFQAPPVTATTAAHLGEIPTGFTMPVVEQVIPGPAPKTFDALVSAEDTFTAPDLPAGFVVPDLATMDTGASTWQPEAESTAWPEPLTFDQPQPEAPILDDEPLPTMAAAPSAAELFDMPAVPAFEAPAPVAEAAAAFEVPAPVGAAAPVEMPEWAGPTEPTAPGESVFTMPEDATPWQAYEQVEQHSQVAAPVVPPVAVPSVPVAAEYAPFEVAAAPVAPAEEPAPAVAAPPALPPELSAMFATVNSGAPAAAAAPQFEVPPVLPTAASTPQFEVPPVLPAAAPAPTAFEVPQALPVATPQQQQQQQQQQFEVPSVVPQVVPAFEVPQAVPQAAVVPPQPQVAPAFEVPAQAVAQPAPGPVQQFEVPPQVQPVPQYQAPPAAPAVPLPPPVQQTQPQPESALPTGFFDDDFAGPAPTPVPQPVELPVTPAAPQLTKQPPAAAPAPAPAPQPAPTAQPVELDEANRLVVEAAPVEARIPLSAVGANLTVNEDWLNQVLRQLVALGISDVHLLMSGARGELLIEGRRDGFLEKIRLLTGREATMVLNLVKSGSRISTGSNRVPADGRYELEIDKFPYQLRAVVTPLFDGGEKVVLRLPQTGQLRPLESLGFTERNLDAVNNLLAIPGGMTLIAGPMGEGKTTTAHAALMRIGGFGRAVMSLEDPVERALFDVAQVEVNEDIGSGFAANMKYLVRSDFDTLFLGEIRDEATASAAVRIAQAGRRVITTIHATNNVTALRKLMQMSEDSALSVLDATRGVISQRLVRRLGDGPDGYLGRHPVHEVLTMSTAVKEALVRDESVEAIEAAASETSTTFAENSRALLAEGITDEREIRRVLGNVL